MKRKIVIGLSLLFALVGGYGLYELQSDAFEREPASIPDAYEELSACQKQDVLWKRAEESIHKELPPFSKFGLIQLIKMARQELELKGNLHSDFAPKGWRKYLHRRGALAKVKVVPRSTQYSGIFQGAECALLRLSITYKAEEGKPFAPGLAFKVLRDGVHSANVSALVALEGQGADFNFFKNALSNIVPANFEFGPKLVHKVFSKVTSYPEELELEDMAQFTARGENVKKVKSPRQIFFVPTGKLSYSSDPHDVREDFLNIAPGTLIYQVHALPDSYKNFDYTNYTPEQVEKFRKESVHIADIVTTSEFLASEFGDQGIFFRHQIR